MKQDEDFKLSPRDRPAGKKRGLLSQVSNKITIVIDIQTINIVN